MIEHEAKVRGPSRQREDLRDDRNDTRENKRDRLAGERHWREIFSSAVLLRQPPPSVAFSWLVRSWRVAVAVLTFSAAYGVLRDLQEVPVNAQALEGRFVLGAGGLCCWVIVPSRHHVR